MWPFTATLVAATVLGPRAETARADALVGDVAAAYSTPEAAEDNPANAAFLEQSQFFYAAEAYKSETINVRYPGFDPTQLGTTGVSAPLSKPSFILKLTPRLGVGGFIIPPLPVTINIKKSKIPVVLVGTQTYIDLNINAQENGIGVATLGYRVNDKFGIGFGADYQALSLTATLTPSASGGATPTGSSSSSTSAASTAPLATITGTLTQMDLILGFRYDAVPGRAEFGTAITIASQQSQLLNVSSPLIGGGSIGGPSQSGGSQAQGIQPFTGALVGFALGPVPRLHVMAEARYTHVNTNQEGYSLVGLKQEPQDLHDTVAVRAGVIVGASNWLNILGGFRYEPSSIGAGSRGASGEVGFGTINLVQVLAGLAPMTPYYMGAVGLQFGLIPKYPHRPKKEIKEGHDGRGAKDGREENSHSYYQLTLEGGISYTYSSVGIDSSGELPGAYQYTKIAIPIALGYKF